MSSVLSKSSPKDNTIQKEVDAGFKPRRQPLFPLHFHANPFMLWPIPSLMIQWTISHKPALTTQLAWHDTLYVRVQWSILWALCPFATARALRQRLLAETDVTLNPITHCSLFHSFPELPTSLDFQYVGGLQTSPREPEHLAVVRTAGIWTSGRIVGENFFIRNKGVMCEENLRIRGWGWRKEYDKDLWVSRKVFPLIANVDIN